MKSLLRRTLLAGSLSFSTIFTVSAQQNVPLPSGNITIVVPFAAGGGTDVVTRLVGKVLSEQINRPVIIENVGGAGGVTGAQRVQKANPDGLTLLMGTVSTHALNPLIAANPPYDPVKDFSHIAMIGIVPTVLLVNNNVPAKTVKEFIDWVKSKGTDKQNYGSSGNGTPLHVSAELLKLQAGIDMTHIPYRGSAPVMNDLISGQIPMAFDVLTGAASFMQAGSVRALGVGTKARSKTFPDLPTLAESGLPQFESYTYNAIFGPANMPKATVDYLNAEFRKALASAELQKRFQDLSVDIAVGSSQDMENIVKSEISKWQPIIDKAGLKQKQ